MSEQKLLLIDSRVRVSGTIENAIYVLDRGIEGFKCCQVKVNYVQLYNTFHNVTARNNEFLFLNVPGANQLLYVSTIPLVTTAQTLTTVIDGILKAVDPSLSAVFDSTTNQITCTLGAYRMDSLLNAYWAQGTCWSLLAHLLQYQTQPNPIQ